MTLRAWAILTSTLLVGCTIHHSRQALWTPAQEPPSSDATFVTEEDSGLQLFGLFEISEPDHYAVLLERARRRYDCASMHHAQLDYFSDHWIIVAFPISRLTLICERGSVGAAQATAGSPPSESPPPASRPPVRPASPPAAAPSPKPESTAPAPAPASSPTPAAPASDAGPDTAPQ